MDLDTLTRLANLSIRRGCGFALLATCTVMVAFAFDPYRCFMAGSILVSMIVAVLAFKGWAAPSSSYKDTEVWMMLADRPQLPRERIQQVIGGVLAERYFWHARTVGYMAAALWLATFFFWARG